MWGLKRRMIRSQRPAAATIMAMDGRSPVRRKAMHKGHEDQRRAEVTHRCQASHAIGGKQNGEDQVPAWQPQPIRVAAPARIKAVFTSSEGLKGEGADGVQFSRRRCARPTPR